MKKLALLGSTGSIGQSTCAIVRHLKEKFQLVALAARGSIELLEQQIKEFNPKLVAVYDYEKAQTLAKRVSGVEIVSGAEGLDAVASYGEADMTISAMSGTIGLRPTLHAIQARKSIALANKETLVSGGALVTRLAQECGVPLIPMDSEHSAIFQCLNGEQLKTVSRLILTASGGPFRQATEEQLHAITVESALAHPNWVMGPKVTIDSSTLMNKGLEVIEAHWLFGVSIERIDVVIHPESIIHSLVEFCDGSLIAQMGVPVMTTPIQYALTYPEREPGILPPFNFFAYPQLHFEKPNRERFRCLQLAFDAMKVGGSLPCFMNAANDVLVSRFLRKEIPWKSIAQQLDKLMEAHSVSYPTNYEEIVLVEEEARSKANTCLNLS